VGARCLIWSIEEASPAASADAAADVLAAAQAEAQELMEVFEAALPLYEGADPRERGAADELPLLAARVLIRAQRRAEPQCARLLLQVRVSSGHFGCCRCCRCCLCCVLSLRAWVCWSSFGALVRLIRSRLAFEGCGVCETAC